MFGLKFKSCLLWLLLSVSVFSQQYPVNINVSVLPPYSQRLSDLAETTSERLRLQLQLLDLNATSREVEIGFSLENASGQELARTASFQRGVFRVTLQSGTPLVLSNLDLKPLLHYENLSGVSQTTYYGLLPEGVYFYTFTVYDVLTGQPLSRKNKALFQVRRYHPPLLTLPAKGTNVTCQNAFQNIVFQWSARDFVPNVQYIFTLREIIDVGRDPVSGFASGISIYESVAQIPTTLHYASDKPFLQSGKRYGWQVRAVQADVLSGTLPLSQTESEFHNQGFSEVFWFDYTEPCDAPKYPTSVVEGTTATLRWEFSSERQNRFRVEYREVGKNTKNQESLTNTLKLSGLRRNKEYEYRVGVWCGVAGGYIERNNTEGFTYGNWQKFHTENILSTGEEVQCGMAPEIALTNQEPLKGTLGIREVFTAGDFPVTVVQAEGTDGQYSGVGYVEIPYLQDTKIVVKFNNIRLNTDRQLIAGTLETTYDKTEKNVQFIQEGIGEVFGDAGAKTNKIDFEIAEIKKDANGRVVVIGKPDEKTGIAPQVVLPAGSDYQLSDASGKVWTLDEQGEVTSVGEKADTQLAQNQNKNNLPKGQVKSENFEIQWDFSPSEFAFDASGEIPYKALVKGKNDVFQVVIKQKDTLRYSFHFQTDKGLKIDSKKEKEGVFEISRKGLFDFADEELWVVAKNAKTEKEEVIGKCVLVHLSEKEVNVTLIPIAENLQIDTEKIKAIYAKVGVKLTISTDKLFPVTETIDTKNAFGDLSTYSPNQQAIIAWYKSERAVKSDTYYVFVGKQEGSQAGYMRLGGQFGFVMDANERTIAHELGHGIFKLEHPFKKDETKKGTFRTLMDYAQETGFAHSDWKQINDPKLKIGFFEGQDDGQIYSLKNSPMMVKRYIEYFRCKKQQGGTIHSDADKVNVYAENIEIGGKKYTKIEIEFLGKNNQEFKNSFSPKDYQNDSKEIDNSFTNKTIVTFGKTIRFTLYPKNNFDLIGYLYSNDKSHTEAIKRDFVNFVNKKTEKEVVEYVNAIDVCTLSELDFEPIKKALIVLTKNAVDKDKSEAILRLISSISEKDYSDFFALLEANNNQIIKKLINDLDDAIVVGNNYYSQFVNTLVQMFVSNPNTWLGKLPKDENAVTEYFTNHYLRKTEAKITDIEELINGNSQIIWQSFYYDKETGNITIQQNASKIQALGGINGKVAYAPAGAPQLLKNTQVSPLSPVLFDYSQGEIQPIKILLDNAGYSTGDLVIVPALFLQFGYDKIKAKTIEKSTLLALNGLTIYSQLPTVIQGATMTKRLWAAAEVAAAVGDIAVNTANVSPEIKQVVDAYNLAMGAIGLKNIGQGGYKFVKNLPNETRELLQKNRSLRDILKKHHIKWKEKVSQLGDNISYGDKKNIYNQSKSFDLLGVTDKVSEIKKAKYPLEDFIGFVERNFTKEQKNKFEKAKSFYSKYNSNFNVNELRGIDFDNVVEIITKNKDNIMYQMVKLDDAGNPRFGSYFFESATEDVSKLGIGDLTRIMEDGRVKVKIVLSESVDFLKSKTTDIEDWTGSGEIFSGGGNQFYSPVAREKIESFEIIK